MTLSPTRNGLLARVALPASKPLCDLGADLPTPRVMQRIEVDLVGEVHVQSLQNVICANRQFELFNWYPFHDVRLTEGAAESTDY